MQGGNTKEEFARGVEQFNRGEFFESHESWEVIWLPANEPDKTFLQGITQVAAAFHHYRRENREGALSLLRRGLKKLEHFPDSYREIRLEELRKSVRAWLAFLESRASAPEGLPRMEWKESSQ